MELPSFLTGRSKSNDLPGRIRGQRENQTLDDGVWAETAGGWRGGFGFTRGCLSNFRPGGGLSTAILRPGRQKQSSHLVPDNNNTTIKQWTKGMGLKWPGGFVWAAVWTSPFFHHCFYGMVVWRALRCNPGKATLIIRERRIRSQREAPRQNLLAGRNCV